MKKITFLLLFMLVFLGFFICLLKHKSKHIIFKQFYNIPV